MVDHGKNSISIFQEFFASIEKILFWGGGRGSLKGWALGYNSMKF